MIGDNLTVFSHPLRFRTVLFWLHLSFAALAGLVIFVMCITGAAMAVQLQVVEWAERDVRRPVAPNAAATPLRTAELLVRAGQAQPTLVISNVAITRDPRLGPVLSTNKRELWCIDPYTGEPRIAASPRLAAFFGLLGRMHTHLDFSFGEHIVAVGNVIFLFLAVSGLYLWWPRTWTWRVVRPSIWFIGDARGRAREWNWHNVFAIWFLPVIVVLTSTGVVLSYRSVNELMFRMMGEPLDARRPGQPPPPPVRTQVAPNNVTVDSFCDNIEKTVPDWQQITINFNPPTALGAVNMEHPPRLTASVVRRWAWPPFTTTTISIDPMTGDLKARDQYSSAGPGRRARFWVRLLHSGDALGWPGRVAATLACLAACVLVYTGYAMAIRRFFGRRNT